MALDQHSPQYQAFIQAVKNGHLEEVVLYLEVYPGFLDLPDDNESRPLHFAAENGRDFIVELLIASLPFFDSGWYEPSSTCQSGSISLDSPDIWGKTPLHYAALGHDSTVELLLQHGSNSLDSPDMWGRTPLHYAARGHDSTVELLLRHGSISIDSPHKSGWTPLHFAAAHGHDSTVELLLRHGSMSLNSRDKTGRIPLDYAAWNRRRSTLRILRAVNGDGGTTRSWDHLTPEQIEMIQAPISEDEILEIRFRIYFSRSLLSRLL